MRPIILADYCCVIGSVSIHFPSHANVLSYIDYRSLIAMSLGEIYLKRRERGRSFVRAENFHPGIGKRPIGEGH